MSNQEKFASSKDLVNIIKFTKSSTERNPPNIGACLALLHRPDPLPSLSRLHIVFVQAKSKNEGPIPPRFRRRHVRSILWSCGGISRCGSGILCHQSRRVIVGRRRRRSSGAAPGSRQCRGHPPSPRSDQGGEGKFLHGAMI